LCAIIILQKNAYISSKMDLRMARKRTRKSHHARRKTGVNRSSKPVAKRARRSRQPRLKHADRVRELDAANIYRQGKAKTVSGAARMAGTTLKKMHQLIPEAIESDPRTRRLQIKATDPYSAKVEILTNEGALIVTARGSRQRERAGQHRATYTAVAQGKQPSSALEQFRGKKVGGHELLSDYERLRTLAKAGVLGQLDTLYVSAGGGR
jgi:hypothetical protein